MVPICDDLYTTTNSNNNNNNKIIIIIIIYLTANGLSSGGSVFIRVHKYEIRI
jgi:hypothetical protein